MHSLPESIRHAMQSGRVPSPPQVLLRLLQLVDDDCTTMTELARLVEQDPGLCTRVLTAANSPAVRRGKELQNIESCLMALGTRLVRSIATCLSVRSLFEERGPGPEVDLADFWTHSLLVAEISRGLAVAVRFARADEAYLAGLLHDVGELIMLSALGEAYAQLLSGCSGESSLPAMEVELLGTHHGEIGTWLVDQWHLDSSFADGILFHHQPAERIVGATRLAQIVWLAHVLADCDGIPDAVGEHARLMFDDLDDSQLAALCAQATQRMSMVADAIGMSAPAARERGAAGGLPRVLGNTKRPMADAQTEIVSLIGNKALLQPLQDDILGLDTDAEVFLALREAARILFDLSHLAFLLHDTADGRLNGQNVSGQAAVFRQTSLVCEPHRSLAAAAAVSNQVRCSHADRSPAPASLLDVQFARALHGSGLLCIPMTAQGGTTGVILAGLSRDQYAALARRLPCLLNFGRIAGGSLENWRRARHVRAQTEEETAARFLQQTRRMVHEAGNPLTIIKGYLRILDGKLPPGAEVHRELGVLTEEIERVSRIVRRMSDIRTVPAGDAAVDIGDLLRELLLLYRQPLFDARGITVQTALPAQSMNIGCDRDSVKQIVLNVWKNASEALVSGQGIRISLTSDVLHQGRRHVELRIEDNGPGMSEAAMEAIHRPRAARLGEPRGIGLSIVGALAQRQGIAVTCRSQPGSGTVISFLLPSADRSDTVPGQPGKLTQEKHASPDGRQE
ncbi:HDOD domain-containing protein [Accumulibacter sp.]|uniref:HDOD domain-containing protein n=1 Tax=Accumulibacter sp. TaxID=2053492 RepID=UPI0035B0922B